MMARMLVERPTPLRPSNETISPDWTLKLTPCRTWLLPYQAFRSRTSSIGESRAQVRLPNRRVLADLHRRAGGDDLAVHQHGDAIREPENDAHVVLDHHQPAAFGDA